MNTILIVDDSLLNSMVLTNILKSDYAIETSQNGLDALAKIAENPPSLVLLDVIMPEMDGFEIIAKIKQMPKAKSIPIIFITGLNDVQHEEKALLLGAVDYITKPFNPSIIKARVNTHIQLFEYRKAIENLVMFDGLTGVHNRRAYDEYIGTEWRRAKRDGSFISVAILDVDFFKKYNDNYGHLLGDDALKTIASAANTELNRGGDYFARYGGEEFAVVMPGTDSIGGQIVAEKLLKVVNDLKIPHLYSDISDHITVSIGGVSGIPKKDGDLSDFVALADKMLYVSKNGGRNRVSWCTYGEEDQEA